MPKTDKKKNDSDIPLKPELTESVIESLILKKVLTDSTYTNLLADDFDTRWFSNTYIKTQLQIIINHYKKYDKTPSRSLLGAYIDKYGEKTPTILQKKPQIMDAFDDALDLSIVQDNEPDNLFAEKQILSFIREKSLYYAIMDNIETIESQKDPSECITAFEKALGLTLYNDLGADYLENISSHFDDLCSPEAKVPIGIDCLDVTMNGGLSSDGDCLMVYMAQPCLGKSLMLSNGAKKVLDRNGFAVVITLELSEKMYQRRFSAHISEHNIDTLKQTRTRSENAVDSYAKQHPGAKLVVKRFPENSITSATLETYLDKLIKKVGRKPDIIFVDYLNLMLPKNKTYNSTMYERVGDISRDLRALSAKFGKPIVTATQVNGQSYNSSSIGLEAVSESKGIVHTADVVVALSQEEDDIEAGIINAKFLKNRYGKNHMFHRLKIDYETLVIDDFKIAVVPQDVNTISSVQSKGGSGATAVADDEFDGIF